jgi:hypothetical protein
MGTLSPYSTFGNYPVLNNYGLPLDYNYTAYTQNIPTTSISPSQMGPGQGGMHWPDTYKLPEHQTFSDQSVYANSLAGTWYQPQPIGKNNIAMYQPSMQGVLQGIQPRVEEWSNP